MLLQFFIVAVIMLLQFKKSSFCSSGSVLITFWLIAVRYGSYSLHALGSSTRASGTSTQPPRTTTAAAAAAAAAAIAAYSPSTSAVQAAGMARPLPTITTGLGAIKERLLRGRTRFELMLPPNYPLATQVYVSVFPSNLINVNDELEIVHMQFAITLEWHDSRLSWQHLNAATAAAAAAAAAAANKSSSANSTEDAPHAPQTIIFYPHEIWIPPITIRQRLYSIGTPIASASAEHYLQNSLIDMGYVEGRENGTMLMIGYFLDAWSCKMRTKLFPFDTQLCHFTLHATTNVHLIDRPFFENVEQMREDYHTFRRVTGSGFQTGEWTYDPEITYALLREPQQFYWTKYGESFVMYRVTITRRPGQHVITWIVPAILLSLGCIIGLYLGCDPSERYSFGAAVIVTLTLMLIGLTDRLPVGEDGFPVLGELYFGLCSTVIIGTLTSTLPEAVRRRYEKSKSNAAAANASANARQSSILRRISAASCTSAGGGLYINADFKQPPPTALSGGGSLKRIVAFNDCNGDILGGGGPGGAGAGITPPTTSTTVTSTPAGYTTIGGVFGVDSTSNINTTTSIVVEDTANSGGIVTIATPPQELTLLYSPEKQQAQTLHYRHNVNNSRGSVRHRNFSPQSPPPHTSASSPHANSQLRVHTNFYGDASGGGLTPTSPHNNSMLLLPPGASAARRVSRLGTLRRRMSQYQHYGGRSAAAVKAKFQTSVVLDYILMFTFLTIQLLMILYAIIKWSSGPSAASFLLKKNRDDDDEEINAMASDASAYNEFFANFVSGTTPTTTEAVPATTAAATFRYAAAAFNNMQDVVGGGGGSGSGDTSTTNGIFISEFYHASPTVGAAAPPTADLNGDFMNYDD